MSCPRPSATPKEETVGRFPRSGTRPPGSAALATPSVDVGEPRRAHLLRKSTFLHTGGFVPPGEADPGERRARPRHLLRRVTRTGAVTTQVLQECEIPLRDPEAPILRPARPTDLEALVALLGDLFSLEADFTPAPERQRRGLALLLDGSPDRQGFVVEIRGRVAGMATAQVLVSTAEGGPVGLVEDVVVAPEHRGRGLGTRLLAEVEAWARARGLTRLQLLADRENSPALRFYERAGWAPTQLACWRRKILSPPGGA